MSALERFLDSVSGRWEAGDPPSGPLLLVSEIVLGAMLVLVIVFWRVGEVFIYQGF